MMRKTVNFPHPRRTPETLQLPGSRQRHQGQGYVRKGVREDSPGARRHGCDGESAGRRIRLFCSEEEKQYIRITKFCHNCHYFGINKSKKHLNDITDKTVSTYISYIEDAFLVEKAERYDIKGKAYIDSPFKYYFQDLGIRNAILSFRQVEETHLMENAIFNELRIRGFSVDVGQVPVRIVAEEGKQVRRTYEVDFVAGKDSQRYYIQSAWRMPNEEKEEQESRPFRSIGDSFKKIIVTGENVLLKRDESGIVTIPVTQFLKDPNSLDL